MLIWICDDHAIVRSGLKQLLQLHFFQCQVQEFQSASEIVFNYVNTLPKPDLIIQDLNLGKHSESGLMVISACKATPILVLTMHQSEYHQNLCLQYGAKAYLNKTESSDVLIELVKKIFNGDSVIQMKRNPNISKTLKLSIAEKKVCDLLLEDLNFKEIANSLSISQSTVATYKKRIMEKLGAGSYAELLERIKIGL